PGHAMADEVTVGGITVPITHPDKVLFPADGITKADLARYYADAAESMLPWLRDRPITMVRYPDGLDGQRFFQKNAPAYFPDWIRRVRLGKEGGEVEHAVCDNPATLVYLANQACIEIHMFTSRVDKLDAPDQMVFDFDPPDGATFADVRRAALWARDLLDGELGLTTFVRTTGGRGLHVHVPLNRRAGLPPRRAPPPPPPPGPRPPRAGEGRGGGGPSGGTGGPPRPRGGGGQAGGGGPGGARGGPPRGPGRKWRTTRGTPPFPPGPRSGPGSPPPPIPAAIPG